MAADRKKTPEFFDENPFDPIETATGPESKRRQTDEKNSEANEEEKAGVGENKLNNPAKKKKAGFYLSTEVLDRFTRKFHELKLSGVSIENKSALLEIALSFALDDIDKGQKSHVLQQLNISSLRPK
jgi:hypothetical protein